MQPKKFSEYTPITETDGSEVIPILKAGVNATVKSEDLPISTATQTAIDAADADIAAHIADVANPHQVTKTQVGLGNADNTSDANKPVSTAQATAIALKADTTYVDSQDALKADQATTYTKTEVDTKDTAVADTAQTNLTAHTSNTSNPHSTTKTQVGLGNADNTSDVDKPISTATQTALDAKATNTALSAHTNNTSNPHSVTKSQVGLGSVDNTSDIDKPVSTAQATAIGLKANQATTYTKTEVDALDAAHVAATDPHTQYMNSDRGDARYAGKPYSVMAKSQFASLPSSYGFLGQTYGNTGYGNDFTVYGNSTQASTPTPDVPVSIVSTTGNVTVRSDSKNLIVLNGGTSTASGITTTHNADGSITLNGTASATMYPQINNSSHIPIYAGMQLTMSSGVTLPTGVKLVLRQSNPNLVYLNLNSGSSSVSGSVGSTVSGLAYAFVEVLSGTVISNLVIRPQVEVGSVATAFEKNTTSTQTLPLATTQLRSLPNGVSDRIYKSGGSWWMEQNVASTVLNGAGSVVWSLQATNTNTVRFDATHTGLPGSTGGTVLQIMSDKFLATASGDTSDTEHIRNSSTSFPNNVVVYINQSRLTANTTPAFQTWLAANPFTVTYPLLTPITTAITDPTLITALESIRTYQGMTNITAYTPVSGSYGLDLTTALGTKVDKTATASHLYATDASGVQTSIAYDAGSGASTIARRTGSGQLAVATPTVSDSATPKSYVDTRIVQGAGAPNGSVTATVGTIYADTAVTAGVSSWIKKSGTGNTGWQVLEGDTGWRSVGSSLLNGWAITSLNVRRINNSVYFKIEGLVSTARTADIFYAVPSGFKQSLGSVERHLLHTAATPTVAYRITASTDLLVSSSTTSIPTLYGSAVYSTIDAWPATLPGTAV